MTQLQRRSEARWSAISSPPLLRLITGLSLFNSLFVSRERKRKVEVVPISLPLLRSTTKYSSNFGGKGLDTLELESRQTGFDSKQIRGLKKQKVWISLFLIFFILLCISWFICVFRSDLKLQPDSILYIKSFILFFYCKFEFF